MRDITLSETLETAAYLQGKASRVTSEELRDLAWLARNTPNITPESALQNVCHTSERRLSGTFYTFRDSRWPELSGWRVRVWLACGEDQIEWLAPEMGDGEEA